MFTARRLTIIGFALAMSLIFYTSGKAGTSTASHYKQENIEEQPLCPGKLDREVRDGILDTWSCPLETEAVRLVEKCSFNSQNEDYGENSFEFESEEHVDKHRIMRAIEMMGHEVTENGLRKNHFDSDALSVGHLTQIIWGETRTIGCAINSCSDDNKKSVLCLYHPRGNLMRRDDQPNPIYEEGEPGTRCPYGTKLEFSTGLCA